MDEATAKATEPKSNDNLIERLIIALGERQAEGNKLLKKQNEILQAIGLTFERIAVHLQQMAVASQPAPNYQRDISEYPNFNWDEIGAVVTNSDDYGVSSVEWNGFTFTRRAPQNKFGEAVWFSRCAGKDSDGNNKYVRLISFKRASEAEPIAPKTLKMVNSGREGA
jgi:hypothetical protein